MKKIKFIIVICICALVLPFSITAFADSDIFMPKRLNSVVKEQFVKAQSTYALKNQYSFIFKELDENLETSLQSINDGAKGPEYVFNTCDKNITIVYSEGYGIEVVQKIHEGLYLVNGSTVTVTTAIDEESAGLGEGEIGLFGWEESGNPGGSFVFDRAYSRNLEFSRFIISCSISTIAQIIGDAIGFPLGTVYDVASAIYDYAKRNDPKAKSANAYVREYRHSAYPSLYKKLSSTYYMSNGQSVGTFIDYLTWIPGSI